MATVAVQRLLGEPLADRPMLLFAVVTIVLGVQSFSLGLLGELIIFTHARSIKDYQIERVIQFRDDRSHAANRAIRS